MEGEGLRGLVGICTGITTLDAVVEVLFFWVGFRDDLRSNTLSVSKDDDLIVESFRGLWGTGGEAGLGGVTTRFSPGNFCDVR